MLGDDIARELPNMRAHAESLMLDSCRIVRLGERGEMDQATGKYPPPEETTVYEGQCRFRVRSTATSTNDAAGRLVESQQFEVHLPVLASGDVARDDIVEAVAVMFDPSVEGRRYTISGRHDASLATARRLPIVEV